MLNEQDKIKELFSEKLGNFEAPVNPALWNGIVSQIGSASAVAASGISLITKVIIGAVACTAICVASYFVFKDASIDKTAENEVKISEQKVNEALVSENEKTNNTTSLEQIKTQDLNKKGDKENPSVNQSEASSKQKYMKPLVEVPPAIYVENTFVPSPVLKQLPDSKTIPAKDPEIKGITPNNNQTVTPQVVDPKPIETVSYTASLTKVPNVFSPDGDRLNDELFIEYSGELKDFSIVIMDKDNKTIYQSQDPDFRWNGIMLNGEMAPSGTQRYIYIITARDSNGNKINKYSSLSIIR